MTAPQPYSHLTPEQRRALLAERLRHAGNRVAATPLSFGQEALYHAFRIAPDSPAYNLACRAVIRGSLDLSAVDRTLDRLVTRHPALRSGITLHGGVPIQRPVPVFDLRCARVDASDWATAALRRYVEDESDRPFELPGPFCRVTLVRLAPERHLLLLVAHHMVSDLRSFSVLMEELPLLYSAETGGPLADLPAPAGDFTDYVWRQRAAERTGDWRPHEEYWKSRLPDARPHLELPFAAPVGTTRSWRCDRTALRLDEETASGVRALAAAEHATPFMVVLAALYALLARYTDQEDVVVASPTIGRSRPEDADVVGYFNNVVLLRADLSGSPTFRELLRQVRTRVVEALDHEEYPLPLLLRDRPDWRRGGEPPVQVLLAWEKVRDLNRAGSAGALVVESLEVEQRGAPFDLMVQVVESGATLTFVLQHDVALLDGAAVRRMSGHLVTLLESGLRDPALPLSRLSLVTHEERRQVVIDWNQTRRAYALDRCLHTTVEEQLQRAPLATAVETEDGRLTAGELEARANQLAHWLRAQGVGRDSIVAVSLPRSLELVCALLGVLKAGGAYLPLETDLPDERRRWMVRDADARLVLTMERLVPRLRDVPAPVHAIEHLAKTLALESAVRPDPASGPDDLAYVIYTSGSTGRPKGVLIPHRGIVNRLLWMQEAFPLDVSDRVLQKTPVGFDVSVWEFFWPLLAGARLTMARPDGHRDPAYLVECIARHGITTLHFVPTMLRVFLEQPGVERLTSLRRVFASGEALTPELVDRFHSRLTTSLVNLYGPTEASIDVTVWPCEPGDRRPIVPIGRPIANARVLVLDRWMNPQPVGVPGEIHIGGVGLARGYANDIGRTAERFVPDPFAEGPGERLYKTGDRGRWTEDGIVEFLGRQDDQVKIDGQRIEPAEVRATLERHPAVRQAHVIAWEREPGRLALAAYVVADQSLDDLDDLRRHLRATLPRAMVPASFTRLPELPLTASGKVDARALPAPRTGGNAGEAAPLAPRTPIEERVAAIVAHVLGRECVGVDEHLLDLGADSLALVRLAARIQEEGWPLTVTTLLQHPTVEALARAVSGAPRTEDIDLVAEATLEGAIGVRPGLARAGIPAREVVLTGTTGFLGTYLLGAILEATEARVHCLVRAAGSREGFERIRARLCRHGLWQDACAERILAVPGDLARPRWGLDEAAWMALAERTEAVYHCGAEVRLISPYAALRGANVGGTHEGLRLAVTGRLKPFHYVSTASVFDVAAMHGLVDESTPLPRPEPGRGTGYAASKWVAESLVHLAGSRGVPVAVYRPGLITGDSRGGEGNPEDWLSRFLESVRGLGIAPDLDVAVASLPVDYVAGALVRLSRRADALGQVFHLLADEPIAWRQVIDLLRSQGLRLERLPFGEWRNRLAASEAPAARALLALLPEGDLPAAVERLGLRPASVGHMSSTSTWRLLAEEGFVAPAIEETVAPLLGGRSRPSRREGGSTSSAMRPGG